MFLPCHCHHHWGVQVLNNKTISFHSNHAALPTCYICNTHFIFADIIQAEIFEPNLSNSIPNSSHIFVHFRALLVIPTFLEPSVRVPCTILWPCLQILCSITLALIVSNCVLLSCCIMIRDIASHAPSVCSFWVLSSFFMRPWLCSIEYLSSPCHVCFHILNIELDPTLICSVGEVRSGPVQGHFCPTGDWTVQSQM